MSTKNEIGQATWNSWPIGARMAIEQLERKRSRTMSEERERIDVGDEVRVNFNTAQVTLCRRACVEYVPGASGDSWVFTDLDTDEVHYVSEGCTITKRKEKP